MSTRRPLLVLLALALLLPAAGRACFGTELRIGLPAEPARALAAYAAGYYVEETTGIVPDFRAVAGDPVEALGSGEIDLWLAFDAPPAALPEGLALRPLGAVPGVGEGRFLLRADVLEDLRFTTVERALGALPRFYASPAWAKAAEAPEGGKKVARKAVLDAQ